ncbi:MAG: hypothetical protein GWN00_01210 [Aliifodinibius sp.]|nr:crossover junction endodeoxyribonuclease RuvC [Fodinibius sp.]NIV09950.1 hypothetical protein [Fodinibius sp.]NIY23480.1 hypothetical protein [Fodinibius sp.]
MRVLGLDPSTKTGAAVVEAKESPDGGYEFSLLEKTTFTVPKTVKGFDRLSQLALKMMDFYEKYKPSSCFIEGYSHNSKFLSFPAVEVAVVLRYFLWQSGAVVYEVPPKTIKKFTTGNGNAGKDLMLKEVFRRFNHDTDSNDEADAIAAAYFGLAFEGIPIKLPKKHLEVLDSVQLIALS